MSDSGLVVEHAGDRCVHLAGAGSDDVGATLSTSKPRNREGEVVLGRYRLDRLVGFGAFARVFHAVGRRGEHVAVKVLEDIDETAEIRFAREVAVLKALPQNRNVVGYVDHGRSDDGCPLLVLEFVDGMTLSQGMRRRPTLPAKEAVPFLVELCHALAGLHALGVAHRDVKPGNILLARDGSIKLIDFGLVRDAQGILKLLEDERELRFDRRVFAEDIDLGILAGTMEYMAPEQFADSTVSDAAEARTDTASDVFSLGVILVELLTGDRPFPARPDHPLKNKDQVLEYVRWRIRTIERGIAALPGIDPPLASIIRKALCHDPRLRQADSRALATELQAYLDRGLGVEIDDTRTLAQPIDVLPRPVRGRTSGTLDVAVGSDDIPELEMDPLGPPDLDDVFTSVDRGARRGFPVEQIDTIDESAAAAKGSRLSPDPKRRFIRAATAPFFELPEAAAARGGKGKAVWLGRPDRAAGRTVHQPTAEMEVADGGGGAEEGGDEASASELVAPGQPMQGFAESLEDDETSRWTSPLKKRT